MTAAERYPRLELWFEFENSEPDDERDSAALQTLGDAVMKATPFTNYLISHEPQEETQPTLRRCAQTHTHAAHLWEGFIQDPDVSKDTAIFSCAGREEYLEPDLYNALQEFLLRPDLGRNGIILAGLLNTATGASELRRRKHPHG